LQAGSEVIVVTITAIDLYLRHLRFNPYWFVRYHMVADMLVFFRKWILAPVMYGRAIQQ